MKGRVCWVGFACLCLATVAPAQDWGEIGVGYAWFQNSGNEDAFRSQYNLQQGFFLENLQLDLRHLVAGYDHFEFTASGFGGEPYQKASFKMVDWDREWSLQLNYSRRDGFFQLPSFDQGQQRDDWYITRWTGNLTWDGWKAARLRLDLHDTQNSGTQQYPFYGLGTPYVAQIGLSNRAQGAAFSLETRTLPVKLLFEEDVTRYTRDSRAAPGNNGEAMNGTDPDVLETLTTPGGNSSTVPTTRLALAYRDDTFEVVGQGLYRRDNFTVDAPNDVASYAIDGGQVGHISYIDQLTGSAEASTTTGDLRFGVAVAPWLTLRARGDYASVDTDMSLLGQRILNLTGPGGTLEIPTGVDDHGYLNHTDTLVTGEADFHKNGFGLLVAYHDGSRDVSWKYGTDYVGRDVTRTGNGWNVTASYALAREFTVEAGYDNNSFEKYIFRVDPQTVNRFWGKLSLRPVKGLEVSAYGSRDTADNPADVSNLDQTSDTYGLAVTYTAANGAFVTASYDAFTFSSDIDILYYAPALTQGVSNYDTNLKTANLRGAFPFAKIFRVTAGALQVKDTGQSLPFTSDVYDLELVVAALHQADFVVFGNYWSYNLKGSNEDDYTVKRYGVSVRWRF
jgi:hypothetical protein